MKGISCLISKPLSPIYINPITRNKPNIIIPCRSSTLHLKSTSSLLANTCVLKHRVYSSSADHKDVSGSKSEIPQVSGSSVPYDLLGLIGITGLALLKARLAPSILSKGWIEEIWKSYFNFLGLAAVFVACNYLKHLIIYVEVHGRCFSIGDIIKVGSVTGQAIDMGPITTSLLTAENSRIVLPNSWVFSRICVMLEEIENLIKSSSNLYSDDEEWQPYCILSSVGSEQHVEFTFSAIENRYCVGLIIGCRLKLMSEEELSSAKQELFCQIADLIKRNMWGIKSLRDIKSL